MLQFALLLVVQVVLVLTTPTSSAINITELDSTAGASGASSDAAAPGFAIGQMRSDHVHASNFSSIAGSPSRRLGATSEADMSLKREVEILVAFKATVTSDPYGALALWSANDSSACNWAFLTCSLVNNRIVSLNLSNLQLAGSISAALGNLTYLQNLDLSHNQFSGSSLLESLVNCSNLSYLDVSHNSFGGQIPIQIGQLISLQFLYLYGNNFTGVIPGALGNCSYLQVLDLGRNSLQGAIPPEFGKLSSLEILDVGVNSLSGSIPGSLSNCSLSYLDVSFNLDLGGGFPPEFSVLRGVTELSFGSCSFTGPFPSWLLNMTTLRVLSLASNQFSGEIPEKLGQLDGLSTLLLGGNNFGSEIPVSITNCTSLIIFSAGQNQLSGEIPTGLGLLTGLEVLDLDTNSLTGFIPPSISNCSQLQLLLLGNNPMSAQRIPSWIGSLVRLSRLDLEEMNLYGEIPTEIGQLPQLTKCMMYGNHLTGRIPAGFGNLTALTLLELSENQLTGEIPDLSSLRHLLNLQLWANSLTGPFPSSISNLTEMLAFGIQHNKLSGTLDENIGRLRLMEIFEVFDNNFEGSIPRSISNWSGLSWLDLSLNKLTGQIVPSFQNLTDLGRLNLSNNMLEGELPAGLMQSNGRIGELDLSGNVLVGTIPAEIGQLYFLQHLDLSRNNFTGSLPDNLGNCTNLIYLDISNNKFTGSVPGDGISKMSSSLTYLYLSHNLLSGAWPPQLSSLVNIEIIDVSVNNLSGPIAPGLERCVSLQRLDLSFNAFTGAIPQELGLLSMLDFFNASYNNFQGPIPDDGAFEANLSASSFLGNPGLCGSRVTLGHPECPGPTIMADSKNCKGFQCKRIWIPTACAIAAAVLAMVIPGALSWRSRPRDQSHLGEGEEVFFLNFASQRRFTERDVLAAVGGGDGSLLIGSSANSLVYKGRDSGTAEPFVVKVLRFDGRPAGKDESDHLNKNFGRESLLRELHILSLIRHRNILNILGFCSKSDLTALVLDYMPHGSLHSHLHDTEDSESKQLGWRTRLKIVLGVGQALLYLHHEFEEPIIHRDLKPSNVLLDSDFEPKVCDFGISKFVNAAHNKHHGGVASASTFVGTIGYIPPEYATGSRVSTKGDIYSYGIILLELVTGKQPTSNDFGHSGYLVGWVMDAFDQERPFQVVDPFLMEDARRNDSNAEQMCLLMRLGLLCTKEAPQDRPSMKNLVEMLKEIEEKNCAQP